MLSAHLLHERFAPGAGHRFPGFRRMGNDAGQIVGGALSEREHHVIGDGRKYDDHESDGYHTDGGQDLPEVTLEPKGAHGEPGQSSAAKIYPVPQTVRK